MTFSATLWRLGAASWSRHIKNSTYNRYNLSDCLVTWCTEYTLFTTAPVTKERTVLGGSSHHDYFRPWHSTSLFHRFIKLNAKRLGSLAFVEMMSSHCHLYYKVVSWVITDCGKQGVAKFYEIFLLSNILQIWHFDHIFKIAPIKSQFKLYINHLRPNYSISANRLG